MSQSKWKLNKLYGMLETTFGVDPSASGSLFLPLLCVEDMTFQPSVDVIERQAAVNDMARQPHVMGAKKGTLAFKLYLKASGTPATTATAAIAAEADPILQAAFGTVTRGSGSLVIAGSSTAVVNVTSGATFAVGMAVQVPIQDGTYRKRFVASIATNALTLDRVLPTAALTGSPIYASSRYTRANTGHSSMAFNATRHGIEYTFTGCKVSCKIAGIGARGSVMLEVTAEASDYAPTTKASLPSIIPAGITAVRAPAVKGAPFCINSVEEPAYSFEFDPGLKFAFVDSTMGGALAGGDGVSNGVELTDSTPGGAIKSFYKGQHFTDFEAGNQVPISFMCGDQTNGWGIYIPLAQHTSIALENNGGMVGEGMAFMVNDNGTLPEYYLSVF